MQTSWFKIKFLLDVFLIPCNDGLRIRNVTTLIQPVGIVPVTANIKHFCYIDFWKYRWNVLSSSQYVNEMGRTLPLLTQMWNIFYSDVAWNKWHLFNFYVVWYIIFDLILDRELCILTEQYAKKHPSFIFIYYQLLPATVPA